MRFVGGTGRLKGHSIRVSNTSDVQPNSTKVCFTDTSNQLPIIIEEDCKSTTRYVWLYQQHPRNGVPILEICEIQVFGMC